MITRINPPELGTPPGYSQIVEVKAERIIFIAGQTALDRDGNVVGSNDFATQAGQVFHNLSIALQASGCTAANLVKLTVFLTDMDNLARYREARNRFFASACGGPRGDAGRGVEAVWSGLSNRDRGYRCGLTFIRNNPATSSGRRAAPCRG